MRIGLACYGPIPTGLGYLARRLWKLLPITSWLVADHPEHRSPEPEGPRPRAWCHREHWSPAVDEWLATVDLVLFIERAMPHDLVVRAKQLGKRLACIPMPEWLPKETTWLSGVDLFLCFTNQCAEHVLSLDVARDRVVRLNCPIDLAEFPYRERTTAHAVVFNNGWGGVHDRKGWQEVRALLAKYPGDCVVRSQFRIVDAPNGSVVYPAVECPAAIYSGADVMLMPSKFEGLGLGMLEAMASGCPVIATDRPPMRDFIIDAYGEDVAKSFLIEVSYDLPFSIWAHSWPGSIVDVDAMHYQIANLRMPARASDNGIVRTASQLGRKYIEREHGESAVMEMLEAIASCDT